MTSIRLSLKVQGKDIFNETLLFEIEKIWYYANYYGQIGKDEFSQ